MVALKLVAIPDVTGDGNIYSVAEVMNAKGITLPSPPIVRLILFSSLTGNKTSRVGDATVSATCGIPFATTLLLGAENAPATQLIPGWDLSQLYIYAGAGDSIAIAYAE